MRSTEEQIREITLRSRITAGERERRRTIAARAAAAVFCLALITAVSALVSLVPAAGQEISQTAPYGSIVITSPFVSYVLVGLLAFLLGISFTMLCLHVQKQKRNK